MVATSTTRRAARLFVLSVCTISVVALFAAIVRQSWLSNSAARGVVNLESQGAEILHPMTTLVGDLVAAQSAAVRGEKVDAEGVRKAFAAVAGEDEEYGIALQTRTRLTELGAKVEAAFSRGETGQAAYNTYTALVKLAVDMERRVGDTSHLIRDPDLDSYYLMDAAIIQLPNAIVLAGQASDLVALAEGKALTGEAAMRAAVARFGVSAAAQEVGAGLNKTVGFTARSDLGSNIADRLDAFRVAADAFAPPTMLAELAAPVDPQTLETNARKVYATANPLAHGLLHELQALLDDRAARLAGEWRFTAATAVLASVLGLTILWLLALTGRRPHRGEEASDGRRADEMPLGSLSYARELLEAEELVHIGRAVRSQRPERGDAQ